MSSFGTGGVLTIDKSSGAPSENADDVAELSDGSLIALYTVRTFGMSFSTQSYLLKLTSNGAVDTSFGTNGYATITAPSNANIRSLKVLSNDSMIVLVNSYSQMVMSNQLVKFTSTGAADSAFGTSGTVTLSENEYDFTVNSADSIFVGGSTGGSSSSATVKKYTSAGVLDTAWATSGVLSIVGVGNQGDGHSVMAVATDASNNIYVAVRASAMGSMASTTKLFRLLADGTNDSSFGSGTLLSSAANPYVSDILVLADGNVVLNSMSAGMTPAAGVSLVSSAGVLDSSHATDTASLKFGNCAISETQIVQLTTGEVMAFGSTYVMGSSSGDSTGSLWKLNFSGVTGGGSNTGTSSGTPAPTLVTSANAAALVRAPGSESIIINGEEVVIESKTVSIPAARTPAAQRTAAQVAAIQQAGAALLQQGGLGSLRVGLGSGPGVMLMTPWLVYMAKNHPTVQVTVSRGSTELQLSQLRERQLDALVVDVRQVEAAPDLKMAHVVEMRAGFVCRQGHPLLSLHPDGVPFDALLAFPIASIPLSQEVARLLVDHYGPQANPAQMTTLQCEDIASLLDVVGQTDAIYLGIVGAAREGMAQGRLVELGMCTPLQGQARLALITLMGRTELPVMSVFRDFVQQHLTD